MVFATLHTNDAPSAVTRLLDLGVEGFLLSSTIRGILAQRLVRVICPDCRERDDSAFTREELALFGLSADTELYRGRGCETCTWTGYYGRQGVFELLAVDDDLRRLVLRNADAGELRRRARESGMKTLLEDGAEKVRRGVTTLQEVFRVTQEV
jgi:type II secretory ATPase GspE/PulE/Tfp pilus assembly ATPase PilB-like protein